MKKVLITVLFVAVCIAVIFGTALVIGNNNEEVYQYDADIFRVRHLEYYAQLISEYKQKTGKYPLQGVVPYWNDVLIANNIQGKTLSSDAAAGTKRTSLTEFKAALEKGLGREVVLKFDPQKIGTTKPVFYAYVSNGREFQFAVYLYHEYGFTRKLGKGYNKLEIVSFDSKNPHQIQYEKLLKLPEYIAAKDKKATKEGYFKSIETKMY